MSLEKSIATEAHLDTNCSGNDARWEQLLAPAPMGIAVLSQLLVSSSVARDFAIDKTAKEKIPLLKHSSFRTTLVQIVNESFDAFMLAHTNMEKIQLQVGQVPDYVKECVKFIKTDNNTVIDNFVPRRLDLIKKAADDGQKYSEQVCAAFKHLGKLIQQVLLAISDSRGAKEKEIEAAIKKQIEEDNERRKQAKEKEKEIIEKEKANAMEWLQRGQEFLLEERKRSRGVLELIFFSEEKQDKIEHIQITVKDAEERLEKVKKEAQQTGKEMDEIYNDCIKNLDNMRVNVEEKIETDEMIKLLIKGTRLLGELQKNWAGMTRYFTSINSYIDLVMKQQHQLFIDDANKVKVMGISSVDLLTESIKKSLESSIKSHRTAATYVKVSDNYIMKPLKQMHGMLALRPEEMEKVQDDLKQSCKNANEGIKLMFLEENEQKIQQVQSQLSAVKH